MKIHLLWLKRHRLAVILVSLCAIISFVICFFLLEGLYKRNNFNIFGDNEIQINETGQVGSFIGGVIGTLISFFTLVFVLLTYINQKDANEKNNIEQKFFALVNIHKSNVYEMEYINPYDLPLDSKNSKQETNGEPKS